MEVSAPAPDAPSRKRRQRADVTYPRKRAVTACKPCRARKIKCNNARPACGSCAGSHPSACVYDDADDFSSYDAASIAILEKLGQVLEHVKHLGPPPSGGGGAGGSGCSAAAAVAQSRDSPSRDSPSRDSPSHDRTPCEDQARPFETRCSAEAILAWPIFDALYPATHMVDGLHEAELEAHDTANRDLAASRLSLAVSNPRFTGLDEEDVRHLVRSFLRSVHRKNPILDPETLIALGHQVAETGIAWDPASCLILVVCALGSLADDFLNDTDTQASPEAGPTPGGRSISSLCDWRDRISRGDAYLALARRRFGLLESGVLGIQCHFLAGMYLMYAMRPLRAWAEFDTASRQLYLYMRCQACRPPSSHKPDAAHQLEQRLYWSCYKAQAELQMDMDLPPSLLAGLDNPDLYPAAPEPGTSPQLPADPPHMHEAVWYYYLTEITLRRFAARTLVTFYGGGPGAWTADRIGFLAPLASEFEEQLDDCLRNLPPVLRGDPSLPATDLELASMIHGRFNELRLLIHRPFLYYVVHNPPQAPNWSMAEPLALKALVRTGLSRRAEHRHHGSWYHLRWIFGESLSILAAARSPHFTLPGNWDWAEDVRRGRDALCFWRDEVPCVSRAIEVLEGYMGDRLQGG